MIQRCYDANYAGFKAYGARGINVAAAWRKSFEKFLEDMGHRPAGMTLERRDNSLGYSKENCEWATRRQQQRNRRCTVRFDFKGEHLTIAEIKERLPIDVEDETIRQRIVGLGWSIEAAFTTPLRGRAA